MNKYKWSLLGLIISVILFLVFMISPFDKFIDNAIIPAEPIPEGISPLPVIEDKPFRLILLEPNKEYAEWYKNVPKEFNQEAFKDFGKSFYHWNLFLIPIIFFSFLSYNYKKHVSIKTDSKPDKS